MGDANGLPGNSLIEPAFDIGAYLRRRQRLHLVTISSLRSRVILYCTLWE
jgi:hypothetical protein